MYPYTESGIFYCCPSRLDDGESVFSSFLFLWLSWFGRRLFTGKVTGNYKWNTPFVVHLLNAKGVGMGDSLTGVLYLFCIGSAAFVLLSFEILPLGLYFLVHFEFGIALGIFVTVLNEYRDKVGE